MDLFKKDGKKERERILKALEPYPYSFQMNRIGLVISKAFEGLRNDLEAGLKAGYSTSLQTASTHNLLAFVLFQLREHEKALIEIEEVLRMEDQRNNIVSLANKAYMYSMVNSFDDAHEALEELRELKKTPEIEYLLVKAKAEVAASYMRFGPRFNKDAIDAFREVLRKAMEPEVWRWKFCLAVTYRHALDLQHAPYLSHGQYTVTHKDVLNLLQEVIDSEPVAGEEAAHTNLKANAYAEMGLLLRLTWDKNTEYQVCSHVQTGPLACCKKALELDDNDASVLWKSGKLYRNYKDLFKSRKLLEKAVSIHPSSPAYHHLGLTYKAMATNLQYGKLKTRRGGKRQKARKAAKEEKMKSEKTESGEPVQPDLSQGRGVAVSGRGTREYERAERIKKAVKSPGDATQFDSNEHNVLLATQNLKRALDFSAGENSRAAYDLALLYKATKNFRDALNLFNSIALRQNGEIATPPGLLEQITSLDQMGLIYGQMADEETDEMKREKLTKKSESKKYGVLALAARRYSDIADVKDIFQEIFQAPSALLKAADASDQSDGNKQKIKARIYSLINNHKQCRDLLARVPSHEQDAEYAKLEIEMYARNGDHEKAAASLSCRYPEVVKLFEHQQDEHSGIFNIFFKGGIQTLSEGPCNYGYFIEAFRHEVKPPAHLTFNSSPSTSGDDSTSQKGAAAMDRESSKPGLEEFCEVKPSGQQALNISSSTSGDDSTHHQQGAAAPSSKKGPKKIKDIMLLYDEEDDDIELKAERLENILKMACGLIVVRRDDNYRLGKRGRKCMLKNIERSRLVVILPGNEERMDEFEEFASTAAATGKFAVLLTEGVGPEAIPQELKTPRLRSMTCPAKLFDPGVNAAGPYTQEFIDAIGQLFKFLVNRD